MNVVDQVFAKVEVVSAMVMDVLDMGIRNTVQDSLAIVLPNIEANHIHSLALFHTIPDVVEIIVPARKPAANSTLGVMFLGMIISPTYVNRNMNTDFVVSLRREVVLILGGNTV